MYWSESSELNLSTIKAFGGESHRETRAAPRQFTWNEWQNSGHDMNGILIDWKNGHALFANPDWASTLNVTLRPDSAPLRRGWQQIDTSLCGLLAMD